LAAVTALMAGPAPAGAIPTRDTVLVLGDTVSGGSTSLEAIAAADAGLAVEVVDGAAWRAKTAADFASYRALVLGDPGSAAPSTYEAAADTAATWGPAVTGNVVVIGTDPVDHSSSGGEALVRKGIVYSADDARGTGLYASLSDAYDSVAPGTEIPALAGLADGEAFVVQGAGCYESAHIIVDHPVIDQLTDENLSNWGCSVHNSFTAFPAGFVPLAIAQGQGDYVAPDGTVGFPYILARGRTTTLAGRKVAAIGDSVSAGEGIAEGWVWKPEGSDDGQWEQEGPRFAWDTTFVPEFCHQTPQAHPRVAAAELNAFIAHFSCTGSTADNGVLGARTDKGEFKAAPQFGPSYDAAQPDIVTVSLGANDIDFAAIVTDCVKPHPRFFDDSDCRYSEGDLAPRYASQAAGLRRVLSEIRTRGTAAGKQPLVVLTQYADPFPLQWTDSCPDLDIPVAGLNISKGEVDLMRLGLQRLNASIASVASEYPGVVVSSVAASYGDHRFCTAIPWTYGPSLIFDKSFDGLHEGFDFGTSKTPFHPTPDGQRALASGVLSAIASKVAVRVGSNVVARTPAGPRLTFDDVSLPGAVVADPRSAEQLPPTLSFRFRQAWDIAVSAVYNGTVGLSLPAQPGDSIWHYVGGRWVELATTYANGLATATADGFSPYAVGPPAGAVEASIVPVTGGLAPVDVAFDASGSTAAGGATVAKVTWDFGDGGTASGATPSHRFTQSGRYRVVARMTSSEGATAEAERTVVVTNAEPAPSVAAPIEALPGAVVGFDATGSSDPNGRIVAYEWDFGDGSPAASGVRTTHAFARPGRYDTRLLVRDDEGAETTALHTVVVAAATAGAGPGTGSGPNSGASPAAPVPGASPAAPVPGASPAAPVPGASPKPGAAAAKKPPLVVVSSRLKGRTLVVRLRCAAGTRCRGRIIVRGPRGELGRKRFRLRGTAVTSITVKLRRAAPRRGAVRAVVYLGIAKLPVATALVRKR